MTIRRTAFAIAAAGALVLTACSNDDDQDSDATTATTSETASEGASSGAGFTKLQLGDTFTYTGDDENPAEVDITVDDINVSNSCHNGIASYMEGHQEDPESTFVQVSGEMDVKANTWSDSFLLNVNEWVAVDAEGYTIEVAPASICETDQINTWSNPLGVGQKRRIVEEFEVKGTPVEWGVKPVRSAEGWGWSLDAPTEGKDPDGPAPTPAADPAPAPAETPSDNGFESGGTYDGPVVPNPNIPGANQPLPGEPGYSGPLTAEEFDSMSNAERSNHGFSAATPNDCDGYLGAHEDPDDSHC